MFAAGIDIGSTASKAVIVDEKGALKAKAVVPIGTGTVGPARAFAQVLEQAGIVRDDVGWITATGYGRFSFEGIIMSVPHMTTPGMPRWTTTVPAITSIRWRSGRYCWIPSRPSASMPSLK